MRKITSLFLAVLFMAAPAMAVSEVTITCIGDDCNAVTVSYASDGNLIRAFALDITTDDANITKVVVLNSDYRIYPGQIVIDDGVVTNWGTPYAADDLGDNHITIEMASLYAAADPCKQTAPAISGTLLRFYIDGDCNYTVDVNALRGGITMEDPYENPILYSPLCSGHLAGSSCLCVVPDCAGECAPELCCNAILAAGLFCEIIEECNDTVPDGCVIRTEPPAGSEVDCGTLIDIVVSNNPPLPGAASNPTPAGGTLNVSITQDISWMVGAGTVMQDVYFGTANPPPLVAADIPAATTTYDTGTMGVYRNYYWRVNEKNECGEATTGTVWCFTTGPMAAAMSKSCLLEPLYPKCLGDVRLTTPYQPPPGNNLVQSTDATALLNYVKLLPAPLYRCTTALGSGMCPVCYDIDGNGMINSLDVTALINRVKSFPAPLYRHTCPYPSCANP